MEIQVDADEVKMEVSDFYFILQIGKIFHYWNRDTGEYDGLSFDCGDD